MNLAVALALNPPHYKDNRIGGRECIEVTHYMGFAAGSVTKYMWRAGSKPGEDALKDLSKASRYLEFLVERHVHAWIGGLPPAWYDEWQTEVVPTRQNLLLLSTINLMSCGLHRQAHAELTDYIKENYDHE